jgi:hypothetical protein
MLAPHFFVIASPSPLVILSEAKNLTSLRVNSAWQSHCPPPRLLRPDKSGLAMTRGCHCS